MPELSPIRVGFVLFPNVTQLDLTGPAQVLSALGNATIDLVAKTRAPVPTDSGFALLPTATFADAVLPDVLCVPGGIGVNDAIEDAETLDWVKRAGASAQWVTSVCTGSLLLGAAGLLTGYRATCHWAQHHHLAAFGAVPVKERWVIDRNRATGGGVTAGIDFGFALLAARTTPSWCSCGWNMIRSRRSTRVRPTESSRRCWRGLRRWRAGRHRNAMRGHWRRRRGWRATKPRRVRARPSGRRRNDRIRCVSWLRRAVAAGSSGGP